VCMVCIAFMVEQSVWFADFSSVNFSYI
jgi:hypothetical protein